MKNLSRAWLLGFFLAAALGQQTVVVEPQTANQPPKPAANDPAADPNALPVMRPVPAAQPALQGQSLADYARDIRSRKKVEVKTNAQDAKELFAEVDKLFQFAADDSGFPQRTPVKRRMVSQADVEKYARESLEKADVGKRLARSELTMKKFGLLPPEFNLSEFGVKSTKESIAGYYDEENKTISLLNWISVEQLRPVLAHELTHALQDQNYDLHKWMARPGSAPTPRKAALKAPVKEGDRFEVDDDEGALARKAVVEGQAMVVFIDYLLSPFHRTVEDTPSIVAAMEDPSVRAVIDTQTMHEAPMILREAGTFPYREGLIFEAELLHKGSKEMAFQGAFQRPPRNTHEVLHPEAYIDNEKMPKVTLPDVRAMLAGKYEVYDSGGFGELDIRSLLKQFGQKRSMYELAPAWRGGAYVAFKRTPAQPAAPTPVSASVPADAKAADSKPAAELKPEPKLTTADLALLYVSRWKNADMAERFGQMYAFIAAKRHPNATPVDAPACAGNDCPLWTTQLATEQGPIIIQGWKDNTVVITESFDAGTSANIRAAVMGKTPATPMADLGPELTLRLRDLPPVSAMEEGIREQFAVALAGQLAK